MGSPMGLLPYSTQISRSPEDAHIAQYQYRHTFPSSDLPTSEPDFEEEYPTPKPLNRNLKRDFAAYSDIDDDFSFSPSSHATGRTHKKRFHEDRPPKFNPATYQLDLARHKIEEAIENSRSSVDLSNMNLSALPVDIEDLNHIVSASQTGTFAVNLELYLTNNRLTTLPESLFSITNLAFLGLSGNRLTSLSPSISKLKNLISLNVGLNQIDHLPANLLKLERLEHLVFHSERIHPVSPASSQRSQRNVYMETAPTLRVTTRSANKSARLPSLCEMAMRVVATHDYWSELSDDYLSFIDLPPQIMHQLRNHIKCDECGTLMCDVYATRDEVWSGFARTEGLPIRRNLCSLNCLEAAPQYEE